VRPLFLRLFVGVQLAVLLSVLFTAFLLVRDVRERRVEILRVAMNGNVAYVEGELGESTGAVRDLRLSRAARRLSVPVALSRTPPAGVAMGRAPGSEGVSEHWAGPSYHRVLASGEVVSFGPVPRIVRYDLKLLLWFVLGSLVIVNLVALVLGLPLMRDLRALHAAVERVGQGDLSPRVHGLRSGPLADLASGFNHMADRINRMIAAQRHLFQAVSHELRTPNARIRFSLDLLEQAETREQREQHVASIDADLTEVDQLVDELLTYLRFDTEAPRLVRAPFQARDVVCALAERTRALGFPVDIEVTGESASLDASEKYFRRAIDNLLHNATRHAERRVRVSLVREQAGLLVTVEDDGPGVPEDERERIFEPFATLEQRRSKKLASTGLGLAIVQRIVHMHGGSVRVDDAPLGGARFSTFWPDA
jgi:two-component system sensor histidine kinase RstB